MTASRRPLHELVLAAVALAAISCSSSADETAGVDSAPVVDSTASETTAAPPTTAAPEPAPTTAEATTTAPPTTLASPTGGVFPGVDWGTAELPADVDRAALDAAVDAAFGAADSQARVRSIVAVQGGEITYERYHPLDSATTIMDSFSVAKSFTSAVVGLLVGDGLLDVTDRAPVEAWADPTDPRHEITIENLLHMASGLEWTEEYGPTSQALGMITAEVASDYVAAFPLEAAPGERFEYSTGTTAILAGIVTDTLGGVEAFDDYVQERLFGPLGITSTELRRDGSGRWLGGLGADSTPRDFARFGLLFLNDGIWDGERILPEGWVDYSHTPSPTNAQYGAQWWMLRPDAFEARGLFGQIVMVSQLHDLVIVINTTQGGDADTLIGAAYAAFTGT